MAVEEILAHPTGGKVEVTAYPEQTGNRRLVVYPTLWGKEKSTINLVMSGD